MMSEEAMTLSLSELEVAQDKRGREVQRLLLQANLDARGTGNVGPSIEVMRGGGCDETMERLPAQRIHTRKIHSLFGEVIAKRTAYGAPGAESLHPLDEEIALPERSYTQEMQRRAGIAAIRGPFDEGVDELAATTGSPMKKLTAEQVVREAATDFDAFYAQRQVPAGENTGPILVCAVDCKGIAMVKPEKALQHRVVTKLPDLTLILDLPHAVEYVWRAAYCFHPEGSDDAKQWVKERTLRILRGEISQVVKGIRQSATKRGLRGPKKETIRLVTQYLYRNRHRMRYHQYLKDGIPIASGAVEGACKNLVKDRFERSGMRWTIPTAEGLLKLRAAYLSDDLDEYWKFHTKMEQTRLYPEGLWRPVEN